MMEISEPAVLTDIPRSLIDTGRTFSTEVYGITNGSKRRRQEICIAVDGNSINIYEVRQGRNLSSCSIPPDSTLLCAPCSFHIKSGTGKKSRNTYYITNKRNETTLSLFREELDGMVQRPTSKTLLLENGAPPVQIDVLTEVDKRQILVAREDGQFEIYDEELSGKQRHGAFTIPAQGARLVAVQWFSTKQASKSVLKTRPDIIAMSDADCSFVLTVSVSPSNNNSGTHQQVEIDLWRLSGFKPRSQTEVSSEPLVQHKFLILSCLAPQERNPVALTSRDTRLVLKGQSRSYVIDLTSTTFRKLQDNAPIGTDQLSTCFISDQLTLISTSTSLQLFNNQFRSLQTKTDLVKQGLKRKRDPMSSGPILFSAYYPMLNRVVAIRRNQLVAIDLRIVGDNTFSTAIKEASLLVSNVGRGTVAQERPKAFDRAYESFVGRENRQSEMLERWQETVAQLDQYLQNKDFASFERHFLEQLSDKAGKTFKESQILTNYKVDYVIAKLIEYEKLPDNSGLTASRNLRLAFSAPQILETLAAKGLLTNERIRKALTVNARPNVETVKYGSISQLMVDGDPSLGLLHEYLRQAPYIAPKELCATSLILLRRALVTSIRQPALAIQDSQTAGLANVGVMTDNTNWTYVDEHGLTKITSCLYVALDRLADNAQSTFTKFMRDSFTQEEIIALVQVLRQQLFRGGYIGSLRPQLYPSPPESENGLTMGSGQIPSKEAEITLSAIASTLCSCVDAIGPIGILSFGEEDKFFQKLVPELSSEISRATEAVQDAISLEGIIREFLRFVESIPRDQNQDTAAENSTVTKQTKPGTITVLHTESLMRGDTEQNVGALPLGLRVENKINPVKVRKGDGTVTKRSQREMAMHQDRLRGPYALERLVL